MPSNTGMSLLLQRQPSPLEWQSDGNKATALQRCVHIIWSHGDLVAEVAASTINPCILLVSLRRPSFHQKNTGFETFDLFNTSDSQTLWRFVGERLVRTIMKKQLFPEVPHTVESLKMIGLPIVFTINIQASCPSPAETCHVFHSPTRNLLLGEGFLSWFPNSLGSLSRIDKGSAFNGPDVEDVSSGFLIDRRTKQVIGIDSSCVSG